MTRFAVLLPLLLCGCSVAAMTTIGTVGTVLLWTERLGVTGIEAWITAHPVAGVCGVM